MTAGKAGASTASSPQATVGASGVAMELRRAILAGEYADRDRLPAERDLAVQFGVSRGIVREALSQLEEMSLVTRRMGSGTFVTRADSPTEDDIADLVSPLEVVDVRAALEPHIAGLAVLHATGRDIERLKAALNDVAKARDAETFTFRDAVFHQALAECTHNTLTIWLYRHINDVRKHALWSTMKDKILTAKRIAEYNRDHAAIVDAIVRRDREAAESAIRKHMEEVRRDLIGAGA